MNNIDEIIKYSKKLKLLYVEDNEEARESTVVILEEFFDDITVAVNGEDGLEQFKEKKANIAKESKTFDLIITDINMPKLNGLEMIEQIRDIDKDIPILVLSAYNGSGFFMESIKLGVDGYLLKPIDINQFLGALNKITSKLILKDNSDKNLHFLKEYSEATNSSSIVSKTDTNGIITYANDEFCKISEYSRDELIGQKHNIVRDPDMAEEIFQELWNTIQNKKQIWKGQIKNRSKSGNIYYVNATIKPILDIDNNIVEYIALRDDITEIMNPKKQLQDAIKNYKDPVIIYMKLEDFNTLEDFYDNDTVEKIEDKVKIYLENNIPDAFIFDKVYQLDHGEYAIVNEKSICMPNINSFLSKLKTYQEKIKDNSVDIFDINYDMSMIVSLVFEDDYRLESAKLGIKKLIKTKNNFIVANNFSKLEHDIALKNIETITMIKNAINSNNIISHFQPIINNTTKEVEKYESLVRLVDEDGKVLSPFFFLETAKKGKYYSAITQIVLDNSFDALKNTKKDITINLSALDIEQRVIRTKIFNLLDDNKQYNSRITFELLEDESVKDFETIKTFITDVKKLGVKIAVDDFGAGYSNFERLLDYQPDILKIDGCLIRDIETNSYSLSVVKTIVAFAKEQGIQTVAEFIENESIFNIVNEIGVDYSQGYYFGKPNPLAV
ncbi:MAG: EAL domain-containing protein [Campylobacterota bacterium]|nr:EAL domain-containing protein [Campylobacterota bacterium]